MERFIIECPQCRNRQYVQTSNVSVSNYGLTVVFICKACQTKHQLGGSPEYQDITYPAISVVNMNTHAYSVYIGRGSKWGNPFYIGVDGTREDVISKFEMYIMQRTDLIQELPELIGKTLGCYCKPKACHGDILKIMVEDEIWNK